MRSSEPEGFGMELGFGLERLLDGVEAYVEGVVRGR